MSAAKPKAPDFLEGRSRMQWERLAGGSGGTLADGLALGRYCALFGLWLEALAFIRKNGSTYPVRADPTERGKLGRILHFREFPQAAELRLLNAQLLAIERALSAPKGKAPEGGEPTPGLFG